MAPMSRPVQTRAKRSTTARSRVPPGGTRGLVLRLPGDVAGRSGRGTAPGSYCSFESGNHPKLDCLTPAIWLGCPGPLAVNRSLALLPYMFFRVADPGPIYGSFRRRRLVSRRPPVANRWPRVPRDTVVHHTGPAAPSAICDLRDHRLIVDHRVDIDELVFLGHAF